MPRLLGNAIHRVEHENGELGANLVGVEIRSLDSPAEPCRRISGLSLVHDEGNDVIRALLTGAKIDVRPRELIVNIANSAFERTLHPAIGSGWRSRTMLPVNVEPVVPVSSTLKYRPIMESSPGSSTVLKSRVRAWSSSPRRAPFSTSTS